MPNHRRCWMATGIRSRCPRLHRPRPNSSPGCSPTSDQSLHTNRKLNRYFGWASFCTWHCFKLSIWTNLFFGPQQRLLFRKLTGSSTAETGNSRTSQSSRGRAVENSQGKTRAAWNWDRTFQTRKCFIDQAQDRTRGGMSRERLWTDKAPTEIAVFTQVISRQPSHLSLLAFFLEGSGEAQQGNVGIWKTERGWVETFGRFQNWRNEETKVSVDVRLNWKVLASPSVDLEMSHSRFYCRRERKLFDQYQKAARAIPDKKEREEIQNLKEQVRASPFTKPPVRSCLFRVTDDQPVTALKNHRADGVSRLQLFSTFVIVLSYEFLVLSLLGWKTSCAFVFCSWQICKRNWKERNKDGRPIQPVSEIESKF